MNKIDVFTYLFYFVLIAIVLVGIGVGIYKWRTYAVLEENRILTVKKKCDEYVQNICEGFFMDANMLGSVALLNEAIEGMYPHMAYLKISSGLETDNACSGTLISEYFILTAAHCVQNVKAHQVVVKLGSVYSSNDSTGAWFAIDQIHIHEEYTDSSNLHDIALLRLTTKVEPDRRIRPICLNVKDVDDDPRNKIMAVGWHLDESETIAPERLQTLRTYMDEPVLLECRERWVKFYNKFMFCAGLLTTRRSNCEIDPGWPLQLLMKNGCSNTYEQIGIASGNYKGNCTKNSSETVIILYTKVQPYVSWIADIVWPGE